MKLNPEKITWTAPTQNVDGTPIDYALAYRLYVDGSPVADFPGSLNTDGRYEMLYADVPAIGLGSHAITMTAFRQDIPELESDQSNVVEVYFGSKPEAPLGVDSL